MKPTFVGGDSDAEEGGLREIFFTFFVQHAFND